MNREDFVAVACRLCAVYLLFISIVAMPGVVQLFSSADGRQFAPFSAIVLAMQLLAAVLLWLFPVAAAKKLLPVMHETRSEESFDSGIALSLAITLIGLWFFTHGVISLIYWLTFYWHLQRQGGTHDLSPTQVAEIGTGVAQVTIALAFIVGTKGISRLIYWMRYR
jgi:hypothetical protein